MTPTATDESSSSTSDAPTLSSPPPRRLTVHSPTQIMNHQQPTTRTISFHLGEEAIGGFAAGIVGTLLGFPLDLVKTRMQTTNTSRSPLSILSHILKTEGLASLYKGVGPPLVSLSIVNTLSFTSYSYFRQNHFHGQDGWDFRNALSGMVGAPLFGLVTTPENFLKTQMQLDNIQSEREKIRQQQTKQQTQQLAQKGNVHAQMQQTTSTVNGRFRSSFQCAKTLVSSHGVPILYTGHVINTVREAAFVGTYFFCYEGYKGEFKMLISNLERMWQSVWRTDNTNRNESKKSNNDTSYASSLAIPMAGGFAGATAWAFTFPLDCVRAGVQGQPISTTHVQKQGAIHTLRHLLQTKGLMGLYSGVGPSIARAFLVSGSRFSAYEGALVLCRWSGLTAGNGQYGDESIGSYDD